MIILDTDILSLSWTGHARVSQRMNAAPELPVTSAVTRIEVLQGRFDAVLKAADAQQLLAAYERLLASEKNLTRITILPIDNRAGAVFNRLRQDKKLRKIGRSDLLIACIALANQATLVTRNVKDFQAVTGLKIENWAD